jgi:hypothetical protein
MIFRMRARKKGQFYLMAAIIIIALLSGLTFVFNYSSSKVQGSQSFHIREELSIEGEKALDYALKNSLNPKALMENFTKTYSNYSDADELYFIFGNKSLVAVAGYAKNSGKIFFFDKGNGNEQLNLVQGQYSSWNFSNPNETVSITANGIEYPFMLSNGENFYFVVLKNVEDERYIFSSYNSNLSGEISQELGGGSLTIASNTTNYNIFEALNFPSSPVNVTLTISSGIVVGSDSASQPALTTGSLPNGSAVAIVNNGLILGKGGDGGNYPGGKAAGLPGENGGTALELTVQTSIQNNGIIGGGGGGGGAGGGSACSECYDDPAAAGGGGAGYNPGAGGTSTRTGTFTGSPGTLLNGGAGGTVGYQGSIEYYLSGDGGSGGNLGSGGQTGESSETYSGGSGGSGGAAVAGSSFATWTLQGDVRGALQ